MNKNRLKIAMLASNIIRIPPIPPSKYVPMVVYNITEELVRRGHDVTLFASGDSETSAKLVSVTDTATFFTIGPGPHEEYERLLISKAYQMAKKGHFDIIHSHYDTRTAFFAPLVDTPTISTLHSPLDSNRKMLQYFKKTQYYASISDNQREGMPDLQFITTAYNGINLDKIPFAEEKEDYLVFAGRLMDIKGAAEAIEVAKKSNLRLYLFGSVDENDDYWKDKLKPHIDNEQIIYKGLISRQELFQYFSKAKAFIFPLKWDEPFGLVSIESMATGTPTISFRKGSLPEIVEDGKTGFIVDTIEEMVEAIKKLDQIKPADCRKRVEEMFTMKKVVDRYEEAYYKILEKESKR